MHGGMVKARITLTLYQQLGGISSNPSPAPFRSTLKICMDASNAHHGQSCCPLQSSGLQLPFRGRQDRILASPAQPSWQHTMPDAGR